MIQACTISKPPRYTFALALSLLFSGAQACITRHMTFDEALSHADHTVVAQVEAASRLHEDRFSRDYEYRIRVLRAERGAIETGSTLAIEYVLHLAVDVNGSIRCPLQRGSGIEDNLVTGTTYRMLLGRQDGTFDLFWAERVPDRIDTH